MVQTIKFSEINEAPYNPREKLVAGMFEYEKLKDGIEHFGLVEPLVWNKRTGNLVGGHQRLAVLKDTGATEAPCSVVDMSIEEEKLLNIALNKIKGEWDYDKLRDILGEFDEEDAVLSGFSADEIAALLASDDDLDDDLGFDDWLAGGDGEDEEEEIIGGSWVITLLFQSNYIAKCWAENEGYEGQVKEGSQTTVIRIE